VLESHLRKPEGPKTNIGVNYAPTTEYPDVLAVGRKLQILEIVALWLLEDFVWKTPISLEMQQCWDFAGTRWLRKENKIILCYEMVREFVQRQFGRLALIPGPIKIAKYGKTTRLTTPDKNRGSNAFRSRPASIAVTAKARIKRAAITLYTLPAREEIPGGGM